MRQRRGSIGDRWMCSLVWSVLGVVSALTLTPSPARASEWWYVNSGAGRVVFVDAKSIERKRETVTYWTMYVIRPGDPEVLTKSHMRAECGKRRLRVLEMLRFDAEGHAIGGDAPQRPGPVLLVAPDTLGDAEFRFACGDESHRVTNDLFPLAVDEVTFAEALIARGGKPVDAHDLHETMVGRAHSLAPPVDAKSENSQATPDPTPSPVTTVAPKSDTDDDAAELAQLEASCDGGTIDACSDLGMRYSEGRGVVEDDVKAAMFHDKACTGGVSDNCSMLGIAYNEGKGVVPDATRSATAFAHACEFGGAIACGNFGLALIKGNGVAKDPERAVAYFDKACDAGDAAACTSLGASYSLGVGVKADARRAKRFLEKACKGDDAGGCYNLGVVYDQGLGVKIDPVRAVSLYVSACDRDDAAACGNLGTLVQNGSGTDKDAVRAGALFRKSCDLGDADGCLKLGRAYNAGSGVTRDLKQAEVYFRRALAIEPDKTDARRALSDLRGAGDTASPTTAK